MDFNRFLYLSQLISFKSQKLYLHFQIRKQYLFCSNYEQFYLEKIIQRKRCQIALMIKIQYPK